MGIEEGERRKEEDEKIKTIHSVQNQDSWLQTLKMNEDEFCGIEEVKDIHGDEQTSSITSEIKDIETKGVKDTDSNPNNSEQNEEKVRNFFESLL